MSDIIDLNEERRNRKKPTLLLPNLESKNITEPIELTIDKSCYTCRHFKDSITHLGRQCGHWPNGDFHFITNHICEHNSDKLYWSKKPGLFRRLKEYLFN